MSEKLPSLDALGIQFGTDKSSAGHDYLNFYESYVSRFRDRNVKILEIGLLEGASLAVWEAYFPQATIVGADIDRRALRFARPRVSIEIVDQSNLEHLTRLALKHGPFDIVVEDGSHMWEHQTTSLRTLFPFVKNGGFYIVEDLQTNFGSIADNYRGAARISCVEYLKKLLDFRVGDETIDIGQEEDAFLRTYGRAMGSMTFSRHVCLIQKSYAENIVLDRGRPFLPVGRELPNVPITLLAHLGGEGDRVSETGWVRAARKTQGIQGFSLNVRDGRPCRLGYRARSATGAWSDWASQGAYVGSRGRADNLTGFSVRLEDEERAKFDLQVVHQFVDSPDFVVANDGGDFIAASGRHHLSGMQIILRERNG